MKKFRLENLKPISTPMVTSCKLCKEDETPMVNQTEYKSMIGRLLYLTASRPSIKQAAGLVAKFQDFPHESHFIVVKMIFKYLKGTFDYGLWYAKSRHFNFEALY